MRENNSSQNCLDLDWRIKIFYYFKLLFKENLHRPTDKLLFLATTLGYKRYFKTETINILSTL